MGKVNKDNRKSNRKTPYPLSSCSMRGEAKADSKKKHAKSSNLKDYEGVTCPVCLESPHNTVLLLCSSHHKGCRPYMCATSSRFSNCLDEYKKEYTSEKTETSQLLCPLCRGQVKGWTVVEEARKHLNSKKRACMHENCSFIGSFRKLKKHVKEKHPRARPRAVDPILEEKWKNLEGERDRRDVISTIMSSTPGAVVLGDYVIEPYNNGVYGDDNDSDDSLDNWESWQGQSRPIHFFDVDVEDEGFVPFGRPVAAPGRGLRRLLFRRSRLVRRGDTSR